MPEDTHQTGLKKVLLSVKLKIQFHGHMLLMISIVKKLLGNCMKKKCKRQIKNNLELKNLFKEKVISYMSNGKAMIIHLKAGLIKKI